MDIDSFEIPDKTHTQSTAHTFERLFGYIIYSQNYTIKDCYTPRFELYIKEPCRIIKNKICHFIYHKKVTTNNKLIVKVLKIPVYHKNLNKQLKFYIFFIKNRIKTKIFKKVLDYYLFHNIIVCIDWVFSSAGRANDF